MSSLILTLIGPDRPGLVDSLAKVVRAQNGNWLESRMSHLAGYFAGIVRIEIDPQHAEKLLRQLEGLQESGLNIVVRKDESEVAAEQVSVVWMELVGNDRPGIVSEVSRILAENNVNVEEFQTECVDAPNSGSTLFRANAALCLPQDLTVNDLQRALESIALDLMVDIKLAPDQ